MDKAAYQAETDEFTELDREHLDFHEKIIRQVNEEYWAAWWFHQPRKQEWMDRLKLYNNQKREKSRIGSPDIFSFHQALLSELVPDQLNAHFSGRIEDDDGQGDNLTVLAENDRTPDEMDMASMDYDWIFDSSLFGRGLLLEDDFDYEKICPVGEVIDPLTWLRDPNAQSVNGNSMGKNGMRFGGREIRRTEGEMRDDPSYFNLDYLRKDAQGFRTFSPLWDTERARKEAQGFQTPYQSYSLTTNLDWTLLQWFTIIDGKKYMVELGNDRTLIVRMKEIKRPLNKWPIIDRAMFPIAHDWDGVSVFDLMEDKQRFRAQLLNIWGDLEKARLYEMWLFDENKIRKNVDMDFEFQKRIPVDGDPKNALQVVEHSAPGGEVSAFMELLDNASQRALGINSGTLGQPQPVKGKQTLGQSQQQQAQKDRRAILVQKLWGTSEAEKWMRWYELYDECFTDSMRKEMPIEGPSGNEYRELKRKDIIAKHHRGPKIKIETQSQTQARKMQEYQVLKDYLVQVMQMPETDKLFGFRKLGEKVLKKREVLSLVPYTFDERQALEENEQLAEGKVAKVKVEDNHIVHLRVHEQCTEDTPELEAHVKMHNTALMMKRVNPGIFPQMNPEGENPQEAKIPMAGDQQQKKPKQMAQPAAEGMNHGLATK